ncbi:GIY-YIG nuclease family protein [Candidatus Wolfebacteria bacterium]|nr:GIY-YIG nuclease family protein [Candidatus Wolfebacteria bacterium]
MAWFVYILLCDQKTFYTGMTNNIGNRLIQHTQRQSSSTKKFSDIKLVHTEKYFKFSDAESREKQIKGWSVAKKKALISGNKHLLLKLSKSRGLVGATGRKS